MNLDWRLIRDLGFAILLALPTAALTRPAAEARHEPAAAQQTVQLALSDRSPLQQRFGLAR